MPALWRAGWERLGARRLHVRGSSNPDRPVTTFGTVVIVAYNYQKERVMIDTLLPQIPEEKAAELCLSIEKIAYQGAEQLLELKSVCLAIESMARQQCHFRDVGSMAASAADLSERWATDLQEHLDALLDQASQEVAA